MIFKMPAIRLAFALALLTINLLFLANTMGFIPDGSESALQLRKGMSESLAIQFASAAQGGEINVIRATLRAVVERNDDIRSAAIRTTDGQLLAVVGEHLAHWDPPADGKSTPTHVHVPVYRNEEVWAKVEIRFAPLWTNTLLGGFFSSFIGLLIFIGLSGFFCYFFIIRRTLRELDPSTVIPKRVQKAFDVLQEGVLILDKQEQILMANASFSGMFGKSPEAMIGSKVSELGWLDCQTQEEVRQLPWFKVLQDEWEHARDMLHLMNSQGKKLKLSVNAAMVTDNAGKGRGALLTFDDITQVEEQNFELAATIDKLQMANEVIQVKSRELETLANHDPLTLCLNRRSLALKFDALFTKAKTEGTDLSCLMVDIDFFKSVNDRYGHATGDQVIKAVADVLKTSTRDADLVGRYGGEEFCVVLDKLTLARAIQIAERIRQAIEKEPCAGINITISLGVSSIEFNTNKPDELINQADKALYAAKKSGRNRIVSWGKEVLMVAESNDTPKVQASEEPTIIKSSPAQLQRRVQELEGLLEKRTLELEHYEMYDFKTGLPTRSLFEDRINHEVARAKRKDNLVAVLSMSVDTIKQVHETLGFRAAEQLVKACGQRLNEVLRENIDMVAMIDNTNSTSTVSLINQTEFGVLLTDIQQVDHVTWVMKRMLDSFEKPFRINGKEIYASAYFGVSIFPHDGQTEDELYSSATNACSYAKKTNVKERYLFSSQNLNEMAADSLAIENALHGAIQSKELHLKYQPKISAATGQIVGFEALLRWKSSQLGVIPPDKFIPVAEKTGQIDRIGNWVIHNVCRQIRVWLDMGLTVKPVAVNVSGVQLCQQNLLNQIKKSMEKFKIGTHLLEVELTESSLVNIYDKTFKILKQIKKMGIRVTMDDFGTGYSSLSYLRDIPLSCLKIDRSFIAGVKKDVNADKLVASIVSMAHGLGLEVVAEGVEQEYQAKYLTQLGCEYLQGFYFNRPMPQGEVADLLQKPPMTSAG
ncbi:MAG: EAL domain-containing protein [Desulfobacteraceae bacterium]|nr:EAL domain-containing protein [Desulfobacteraceae bacterium]